MGLRFVLDGEPVAIDDAGPHVTLLQWLRAAGHTGTKEGCAEGECGACAVAMLTEDGRGRLAFEPVNSCLVPLASLAGRTVITSEGIARIGPSGRRLHPVQAAMIDEGGSQCGYCTPGFVVSLFCEYYRPGRSAYDPEAIAGNLCRCTGYRPIVAAARGLPLPSADDPWFEEARRTAAVATAGERAVQDEGRGRFVRPSSLREAFEALAAAPDATLIAGGTDLMVAANQRFERWSTLIALDSIAELLRVEWSSNELTLGAAVTLSRLAEHLGEEGREAAGIPLLSQLLPLFSSRLIRNRATLGGNLATASPIGDAAPVLLALDAELTLASVSSTRRLALRDFFVGYRKTALERGELIAQIHVPLPLPRRQRFYKVSKRALDDISTIAGAFALSLSAAGHVERLRVAYGGVASTPLRAIAVEDMALGRPWTTGTLAILLEELEALGTPLSDHRGSAAYRRAMIGKLFERFFVETEAAPEIVATGRAR